jgi:hypothetical protein
VGGGTIYKDRTHTTCIVLHKCNCNSFLMKLDLSWKTQKPITTGVRSSLQLSLGSSSETFLSSAVHCCRMLPFSQCELPKPRYLATLASLALNCMTWLHLSKKQMNTVDPSCCIAFFWLAFTQTSWMRELQLLKIWPWGVERELNHVH